MGAASKLRFALSQHSLKEKSQRAISEVLHSLKIGPVNAGVFDGHWKGDGPVVDSLDPATNEAIAKIRTVKRSIIFIYSSEIV